MVRVGYGQYFIADVVSKKSPVVKGERKRVKAIQSHESFRRSDGYVKKKRDEVAVESVACVQLEEFRRAFYDGTVTEASGVVLNLLK